MQRKLVKMRHILSFCMLILRSYAIKTTLPFSEIDVLEFTDYKNSLVTSFTDLNVDKRTDVLIVSTKADGQSITVLYGGEEDESLRRVELLTSNLSITTIVPADFNGDLQSDLLLVHKVKDNEFKMRVCYSAKSTLHYESCVDHEDTSVGEPLIVDYNADMKPDIIYETAGGNLTLLISGDRNFTKQTIVNTAGGPLIHPHSSAFVDLNRDLSADIALTKRDGLLISLNKAGVYDFDSNPCLLNWNDDMKPQLGMVSFADIDSDSYMDIVVTLTKDSVTSLYVVSGDMLLQWLDAKCTSVSSPTWTKLDVKLVDDSSVQWSVSQTDSWLRMGDVDNDGYLDILMTVVNTDNSATRPVILHSVDCNNTCSTGRTFTVMWSWLPIDYNITQVMFYDLYQDGMLDVIYNAKHSDYTQLHVLKNNLAKQSCFVSVKVGSGLCSEEDVSSCNKPYSNIVGPTVQYNSTHPDGSSAFGIATQLTQCTNQALQVPYIQFGLGTTPNFVDSLTVGVARKKDQLKWTETWKTIVPNSHLVVVPRPPDQPDKWLMHLYVTPSHLVLITGAVILGICGFISIIIGILHFCEKRQDKKAKQQEAHRFHFNAM